jgi:hypothetical protein
MNNRRVKHIINEKNGIVAAEIKECMFDAENMMNDRFIPSVTSSFMVNSKFNGKYSMNPKYRAVARLHPEDNWDESRGKVIATNKLTEVYHDSMNKRLAKYAEDFRKIADNIEQYLVDRHFYEN